MAIYHASTKPIARSAGRSAVAAAAYRAGVELVDARTGLVHDYTRKGGVLHTEILTPDGTGAERNALWDAAEAAEKRKDARTAREWIVALPAELDAGQRCDLAHDFAQALVARYGVAADLAMHAPDREGDHRNHHAHILTTTRQVSRGPDGGLVLGAKAHIDHSDKARRERGLGAAADEVKAVRELWERTANAALERAGVAARIDARSLQAQGIDQEATQHLGPVASEMERRGKASDRGDGNRAVSVNNTERARLAAEIVDLHAERARRIRREQAREAFAASHREICPDVGQTVPVLAGAVAAWASQDRADIQERWDARLARNAQKEAAHLAGMEARRQKLLDLAESLRNDKSAGVNLREAYLAAGYVRERREEKVFFVYPPGDMAEERKGVSQARIVWNERAAQIRVEQEQAEQERQEQEERALDDQVAAETAPGVRQPQRTTWRAWRAQTLSRRYDPAYSAEMAERDIYCRWMPEHQGLYLRLGSMESERMEVIDQGPLLLAKNGVQDIPLLIETAKGKGWNTLEFTGSPEFQEQAAIAALEAGLSVADGELAQRARERVAAEREAIEQDIKERADSVGYRGEIEGWEEKQRADDPEYQRIIRDLKDDPSLTEMANVAYQQGRARGKREVERLERRDSDPALVADVRDRAGTWYHLSVFMHDGELAATLRRTLPSGELATIVLKTVVPEKEQVLLWVGGGCIVMLAPNAEKDGVEMVIGERDESGNIQPVHERPGRLRANEALQNIPDHREGKAIEQALGVAPKMLNPAPPRQVYKAPAKTPGKQKGHGLDFDM